ncbi:tRNA (adenine-N1)-methyltransferase [Thermatribacter velox]|uniref:tRNA (adenine(58)-N(1))-methyltransferase TrmI n=1 Tax=Thermatribacter velox TaxID=3039681 RepID=A0ABZ2YB67_9BACT
MEGEYEVCIREGERVYLLLEDGKDYLIRVEKDKVFGTHLGGIAFNEIIGKRFGELVLTTSGRKAFLLQPGIVDNLFHMKRRTQIVYPKDLGFIVLMLDVKEGDRVIDVGLGSGAMCGALARLVGDGGKVYAYERREEFIKVAVENLSIWGVLERVEIKNKDIKDGFEEENIDALFLDVPQPWDYLEVCWRALRGGGRIGIVSPTTPQVVAVLEKLKTLPFIQVEVWESLFRKYKPNPIAFRPYDRMVAHTTYMIFARKVFSENP